MCCEGHTHHHRAHGAPGCWHGEGGCFQRRFLSREEKLGQLKAYLEDLRAEAREVEKRIECLGKEEE